MLDPGNAQEAIRLKTPGRSCPKLQGAHSIPLEDELIIVDCRANRLAVLNPTGRLVWEWLHQGLDLDQIAERLVLDFGISKAVAKRDVEAAYSDWESDGWLTDEASTARPQAHAVVRARPSCIVSRAADSTRHRRTYVLAGVPFSLHYQTLELETRTHPLFAHLEGSASATARCNYSLIRQGKEYVLLRDQAEIRRDPLLENLKGHLLAEIVKIVYPGAPCLATVHAGAVSGSQSILLPGAFGSGKSTLVAALVHSGLAYLSDDFVALDSHTHHILPVPVSMCIKEGSWKVLSECYPELEDLPFYWSRGRRVRYLSPPRLETELLTDMPICGLVFPKYMPGKDVHLKVISPAGAVRKIIEAGVYFDKPLEVDRIAEFLNWLVTQNAYDLCYGDLKEAVSVIRQLVNHG